MAQYDPSLSSAWIQWTQVESAVEDFERVRAIFELAVQQGLDMPEIVWKVCAFRVIGTWLIPLRHISISRLAKASEKGRGTSMNDCWSGHHMSRCVSKDNCHI